MGDGVSARKKKNLSHGQEAKDKRTRKADRPDGTRVVSIDRGN